MFCCCVGEWMGVVMGSGGVYNWGKLESENEYEAIQPE